MAGVPRALFDLAAGRAVSEPGDPETLTAAAAHGLSGLLWSRVADGEVTLPRDCSLQLAALDVTTRERHARLTRALVDAMALLDGVGLTTAAFKGVMAERRWYERTGERPCADVDLLVAPDAVGRLGEAVDLLNPRYVRRAGLERRVQLGLQQAATVDFDGVTIDLHVEVPKFGVPSRARDALWERVETQSLEDGREIRVLDAEGHLFAFLTSVVKDRFARLVTYSDLRRIASSSDLDWDCVERLAALDAFDRPGARALDIVADTLDIAALGPWRRPARPSLSWAVLCRPTARLAGSGPRPRSLLVMPLVIPGRRREVARSLARRVWPPHEIAGDLYPDGVTNPVTRLRRDRHGTNDHAPTWPTVSVIIPTYQRRDLVLSAVRSVIDQQVPPDEIIVVDDGSTDGTAEALEAAFGSSVRVVRQPNRGPSAARNEGVRIARGDVIAFQDSDDRWRPHHLALIHELLAAHPDAVLIATSDEYEFGDERVDDACRRDVAEALLLEDVDLAFLSTVACPREVLAEIGGFDEQLRYAEDVDLFIRLALHGPFVTMRASTVESTALPDSLEAAGRAQGLHAEYVARSADNALREMSRPAAVFTDATLHAAMARRAIAAILVRLEAGAPAAEIRPFIDEALRWRPELAASTRWIVRHIDAATRGRDATALHRKMLATVEAAWPTAEVHR